MALSVMTVLALLHIVSAIAWMGALVFFLSVVGPAVRTFSPTASLEFLTKVGPRQLRYFGGSATATIIFGFALAYVEFGSDMSTWPTSIYAGMTLGLVAWLIAVGVTIPTFRRVDKIAHQVMANPQGGPPPAELGKYLRRGNMAATLIGLLLILALIFMVVTGFG